MLLFLGLDEGSETEGYDREHMRLRENQLDLLREIAEVNPNVGVVLQCGSPVEMTWDVFVRAVLHLYLGGQAVGSACAALLTGEANPSGKLAETMPSDSRTRPARRGIRAARRRASTARGCSSATDIMKARISASNIRSATD